jgi:hypothetical protein
VRLLSDARLRAEADNGWPGEPAAGGGGSAGRGVPGPWAGRAPA